MTWALSRRSSCALEGRLRLRDLAFCFVFSPYRSPSWNNPQRVDSEQNGAPRPREGSWPKMACAVSILLLSGTWWVDSVTAKVVDQRSFLGVTVWRPASIQMHGCICYHINNNYFHRPPIGAKSKAGHDMVQLHQKGKDLDVTGFLFRCTGEPTGNSYKPLYKYCVHAGDHGVMHLCGGRNGPRKQKTTAFQILSIN